MSAHRLGHFGFVAVVGFEKIGADKKEDYVRVSEPVIDLASPVRAGQDAAIMPFRDEALTIEDDKLTPHFVHQRLVLVSVGEEDFNRTLHWFQPAAPV